MSELDVDVGSFKQLQRAQMLYWFFAILAVLSVCSSIYYANQSKGYHKQAVDCRAVLETQDCKPIVSVEQQLCEAKGPQCLYDAGRRWCVCPKVNLT